MWMEHSRTWFNGGLGIVRLMTGLSSLKGLLQLKKKINYSLRENGFFHYLKENTKWKRYVYFTATSD